jgi:sporulation protein YlmC with PRC-barrel domain
MTQQTLDLTISAKVYTTDGDYGRLTNLVLDPESKTITHLVVAAKGFGHIEHVVPLELVLEGTPDLVRLRRASQEVDALPEFIETDYVREQFAYYNGFYDPFRSLDVSIPMMASVPMKHQVLPPGELAINRGARVQATDGQVGRVDEMVVDVSNGNVTQLFVHQGHLWARRDVAIPAGQITRIADDAIYLSMNMQQVGELPIVRPHTEPV